LVCHHKKDKTKQNKTKQVNCAKQKKLTNVRSSGADEKLTLQPPRQMSLEDYITYMGQDEVQFKIYM
jgi:predicted membrane GTPase involved in stress response